MKAALEGITRSLEDDEEIAGAWRFFPFGWKPGDQPEFLTRAVAEAHPAMGCAAIRSNIPFPLPDGEPEGRLYVYPGARCGIAILTAGPQGASKIAGMWPFTNDGVEHEVAIEALLLSSDRLQGIVQGTISNEIEIRWIDVNFPIDRGFHARGSVHSILLAGIVHLLDDEAPPPIKIGPESPTFRAMAEIAPESVGADGMIEIKTNDIAAFLPAEGLEPATYDFRGRVRSIAEYPIRFLDRLTYEARVTIARLDDKDIDISLFITDIVLDGRAPPKPGDSIGGVLVLQGRIWQPNIRGK